MLKLIKLFPVKTLYILLALLIIMMNGCETDTDQVGPNVILIITDDQGYGDLGFHGNPYIKTPFLDSLAGISTRFDQFYVCPVCAPTRAGLMTGRYALRTGVYDTYNGGAIMHTGERTIPEILGDNGYRTGMFGKWHLGDNYPFRPIDQGFDESLVHRSGGIGQPGDHFNNYMRKDSSYFDPVLSRNGKEESSSGYCSDVFTDAAIKFIDSSVSGDQGPFFLYLSYNAPHTPLQVPTEYYDIYEGQEFDPENFETAEHYPEMSDRSSEAARKVYAMVTNIDDNLSRLMAKLSQHNIQENTLLIFMTDNGPQQPRYTAGLRQRKGSVYEGGIRVPCFMYWKGKLSEDREIRIPAANIDILPTIMDLCDIDALGGNPIDGKSLEPFLFDSEETWEERTLFFEWGRGFIQPYSNIAVRRGDFKMVGNIEYTSDVSGLELYNIAEDPFEQNDISAANQEILSGLTAEFDGWYQEVIYGSALTDPPRIVIGSEYEDPVVLNRNDWKGGKINPWTSTNAFGYWDITFEKNGLYDARLVFSEPLQDRGRVFIRAGTTQRSITVSETGSNELHLPGIPFRKGDYMFEAWFYSGVNVYTPAYIEIDLQ